MTGNPRSSGRKPGSRKPVPLQGAIVLADAARAHTDTAPAALASIAAIEPARSSARRSAARAISEFSHRGRGAIRG